jgi:hypothetical protein
MENRKDGYKNNISGVRSGKEYTPLPFSKSVNGS